MSIKIPWLSDRLALLPIPEKGKQVLKLVIAATLAVVVCVGMKVYYDNQIISKHEAQANVKVLETTVKANEAEAEERASDVAEQQEKDNERVDAIAKATETTPSDPAVRLNCVRLRQAGYDTTRLPACTSR